jgi:hypothetical protein
MLAAAIIALLIALLPSRARAEARTALLTDGNQAHDSELNAGRDTDCRRVLWECVDRFITQASQKGAAHLRCFTRERRALPASGSLPAVNFLYHNQSTAASRNRVEC